MTPRVLSSLHPRFFAFYGFLILSPLGSATTIITLTSTPTSSSVFGTQVTLKATVSPSSMTGTVTFYDGVTILGIDSLSSGVAKIKTILLTPGTHSLTAQYNAATPVSSSVSFTVTANGGNILQPTAQVATGTHPYSVVVDDFDRDGKADLAVANYGDGTVDILLGNGHGGFTLKASYNVGGELTSIATGYFHGNLKVDLVVTDEENNAVTILTGHGDGTFAPLSPIAIGAGTSPFAVAVSDFDGDGKADIAVANNTAGTVSVFLGKGDGTFSSTATKSVGSYPRSLAVGDVNGDGKPDLVVANPYSKNISVLIGNGNGTFQDAVPYSGGVGQNPSGIALGDFNGDSFIDIASASTLTSDISVLLNSGSGGLFDPAVLYPVDNNSFAIAIGDFNGDTKPDLAVGNAYSNKVSILAGNGDGTFQPPIDFPTGTFPISLAIADFNGDGVPDLAVANEGGNVSILLGVAYSIAKTGGDSQSAPVNTTFGAPLQVLVKNASAMAVSGATVTFTAPAVGPSATFSGSLSSTTTTGGLGQASSGFPTANSTAGTYSVGAQVGYGTPTLFSLTNTPVPTITATGTPQPTTVNTPFGTQLKATYVNAMGAGVSGVTVTFTAPGIGPSGTFAGGVNTATTDGGGVATSAIFTANTIAGSYVVTASAPGVQVPASFMLTNTSGPAYKITATSGTGQSTSINAAFQYPLAATVVDQYGNPVPTVTVTFTPPISGASGTFALTNSATTNASGVATSTVFTANGTIGSYSVSAAAPPASTPASFSLTNTGGIILPSGLTVSPGQSVAFPVTLGSPAASSVLITLTSGDPTKATVSPASVLISAGGTVSTQAKVTGVNYGTVSITASGTGYASVSQSVHVIGSLSFSPTNLTIAGTATQSLTLTLSTPAPAGGVMINLSSSNPGFASVPATVTISGGSTSVSVPVTGVSPGPTVIHASLMPDIPDTTANITVVAPLTITTPSLASGVVGTSYNQPLSASGGTMPYAWALTGGSLPSLLSLNPTGAIGGTPNVTATNLPLTFTVTDSSSPALKASATLYLTVTSVPVKTITASSGAVQTAMVNNPFGSTLQALVKDSMGNPVSGTVVTFTAPGSGASGTFAGGVNTATTLASGVATSGVFTANTTAGSYTITASAPGVVTPASYSMTNSPGPATTITVTSGSGQTAAINSAFSSPLSATVKDQYLNPVAGVLVTFTPPASGAGGTFSGTNTATTNASGVATSTTFTANSTAGSYTVSAGTSGVGTSAQFSLTNSLGIILPSNLTVVPGQSIAFPVSLATPAAKSVVITLSSSNTSLATVTPTTVLISAGASSNTQPKVNGISFGSVTITANATGFASVSQTVQVAGALALFPSSSTITGTATEMLTLSFNPAVGAAGLTVNLNSSTGAASVPATVFVPATSTSVKIPVTGVSPGAAAIVASAPNYVSTSANVTVN